MDKKNNKLTPSQLAAVAGMDTLENAGRFYLCYQDRISETVFRIFDEPAPFTLSWPHYLPDKKLLQKKLREWIEEETGGDGE